MSSIFFGASFDATDAVRAAQFWAAVLDRTVADGADAHDAVVEAGDPGSGPRLAFHKVPEAKSVKHRFHADLITRDYEGESEHLLTLGASGAAARRLPRPDPDVLLHQHPPPVTDRRGNRKHAGLPVTVAGRHTAGLGRRVPGCGDRDGRPR